MVLNCAVRQKSRKTMLLALRGLGEYQDRLKGPISTSPICAEGSSSRLRRFWLSHSGTLSIFFILNGRTYRWTLGSPRNTLISTMGERAYKHGSFNMHKLLRYDVFSSLNRLKLTPFCLSIFFEVHFLSDLCEYSCALLRLKIPKRLWIIILQRH